MRRAPGLAGEGRSFEVVEGPPFLLIRATTVPYIGLEWRGCSSDTRHVQTDWNKSLTKGNGGSEGHGVGPFVRKNRDRGHGTGQLARTCGTSEASDRHQRHQRQQGAGWWEVWHRVSSRTGGLASRLNAMTVMLHALLPSFPVTF